jgi:hypothetical protein
MICFDERLHIDAIAAEQIESTLLPLFESPTLLICDGYPFPLAAEFHKGSRRVRAATGTEITDFLTMGIPTPDDFEWPGDPASPLGQELDWQVSQHGEVDWDRACHLWNGEVILKTARGLSSPFYIHREAARAWALSTALTVQEPDIFELQMVPYACIRKFAPALIMSGEEEYARLSRFWISPVRSWGQVERFALPGAELPPW